MRSSHCPAGNASRPRHISDADGWELAGAGWLMMRPDYPLVTATPSGEPPPTPPGSTTPEAPQPTPPPAPPTWWNVATGQRLTPNLPHGLDCYGLWCVGRGDDHLDFYRFDASVAVSAKGPQLNADSIQDGYFAVIRSYSSGRQVAYLWDLRRNVAARLGVTPQMGPVRSSVSAVVIDQSPSHKTILDLTLI